MTTKFRRGRDPEQHVLHAGRTEANRFKGSHGELTFVASGVSPSPKAIVELRAHNGLDNGGYGVQMRAASDPKLLLEQAVVYPELTVTVPATGHFIVVHDLGYRPLIQFIDPTSHELLPTPPNADITVTHGAANSFRIDNADGSPFEVVLLLR